MAKAATFDLQRLGRLGAFTGSESLLHWRLFQPRYPPLAVEVVGPDRLQLVQVDRVTDKTRKPRRRLVVRRHAQVEVPEGALQLEFSQPNVLRPSDVGQVILRALEEQGIEARGISIVLPDTLARTSLLHLGERPGRRNEILDVIRWKLRKAVPFRVEDAHIDYQMFPSPSDGGAHLCQAVLVLRAVLESYERLMDGLGLRAGLLDLSTFNLVNLYRPVLDEEAGDSFLLNVTGSFFALMILRGGVPIFYRSKTYTPADRGDRDRQRATVAREVDSSLTYYRERLSGRDPVRIHVRCIDLDLEATREVLEERVDAQVMRLDPARVIEIEPNAGNGVSPDEMLQRLAPALGAALGREG